jgi:hypothetical protein
MKIWLAVSSILARGWFYGFALLCSFIYEQNSWRQEEMRELLFQQQQWLQEKKRVALQQQKALKEQVSSQGDKYWTELILKKELGVIDEGEIKVFFVPAIKDG